MPIGTKPLSIVLVVLFLGSLTGGFTSVLNQTNPEVLDDEPDIQMASQATSPGHVVFGQYISSDNCGHCSKNGGGSDAHHSLKQLHPDEYVYVSTCLPLTQIQIPPEQETLAPTIGLGVEVELRMHILVTERMEVEGQAPMVAMSVGLTPPPHPMTPRLATAGA